MHKFKLNVAVATIILLNMSAFNAQAEDDDMQEIAAISKEFGLMTLEQAKTKALAAKPGLVTDAEIDSRTFGKGWAYEFEIVDADGKEWDVHIDAKTGEVLKTRREWF